GTLISYLMQEGYKNILGLDLSEGGLKLLEEDLKNKITNNNNINFMVADLSEKISFSEKGKLWHDRAVFHFLLKKEEREEYKKNLINFLKPGGIFIISCFHEKNKAEMCNGLPLKKTTIEELAEFFEEDFSLLENLNYEYSMPWGDKREFLYGVFKKK
ncbi:MAG: methyltransferase domain-containing protein, partial [Fusobacteriaceae bacterium]